MKIKRLWTLLLNIIATPFNRIRDILVELKRDKAQLRGFRLVTALNHEDGYSHHVLHYVRKEIEHVREHYRFAYVQLGLIDWADLNNRIAMAEARWELKYKKEESSSVTGSSTPLLQPPPTVRIC
ncbi:MAG: hypothetical protein V4524_01000 [Patescibacteria group bacterium]